MTISPLLSPRMKERLLAARLAAGLTQARVAEILKVNQSSVSQWETGRSRPEPARLPELADLYKVAESWLDVPQDDDPPVLVQSKPERDLLLLFRRLDQAKRETALTILKALTNP